MILTKKYSTSELFPLRLIFCCSWKRRKFCNSLQQKCAYSPYQFLRSFSTFSHIISCNFPEGLQSGVASGFFLQSGVLSNKTHKRMRILEFVLFGVWSLRLFLLLDISLLKKKHWMFYFKFANRGLDPHPQKCLKCKLL